MLLRVISMRALLSMCSQRCRDGGHDDHVDERRARRDQGGGQLEIAPRKRDGTLRKPLPIWAVRVGDDVYVRAAYGPGTGWHRVARTSREARIRAGGVEKDVTIEDADDAVNDQVTAAYKAKYSGYEATSSTP